ncbi:LytTR family DNA-binding domain-containing protein [Butyrivibrio sp. INlla16]|uniref:LytR/AlgR family response regulator transcription factor n=1 Tax=Butyrivibrio sp. INlla16 TaxID=1520807 RepID=UPI000889CF9F|nr:LytTR family DNA-binding domain-containing protein [Butyrivibrio sp. INlla16]SDB04262.1 two component transcriptional regulator, LytTR family [Butyrivibrio sp. INlla16]
MGKYCFAVCDDEKAVRDLLHVWLSDSSYKADIREYVSGEELIKDIDAGIKIDVLFLDIAMDGNDGIETARELGCRIEHNGKSMRASRPLIIYVTGIPDRMGDAFGVKAYGYLLKPVDRFSFDGELHRAIEELKKLDAQLVCETTYEKSEDNFIALQSGKGLINLNLKDVLYIESSGRKAVVHLPDQNYEIYKPMSEFECELGKNYFRIHRGYIVNMKHVKGYSKSEAKIDNGESLIISKYKYADFIKAYLDFIS